MWFIVIVHCGRSMRQQKEPGICFCFFNLSPILGRVSNSGQQFHSFGIVLRLWMQTEVTLYKVPRGHVTFPIFHHAGVLQGETHTNVDIDGGRLRKSSKHSCSAFYCKSVLQSTHFKLLVTCSIVPKELHIPPPHPTITTSSPMPLSLFLDARLEFQLWNRDSSESTSATWARQWQVDARGSGPSSDRHRMRETRAVPRL